MTLRFRALWPGSSDYSIKPPFLGFRSSKAFVVVVVSFMVFTDTFLYCLVVPVIPRAFEERLHVPRDEVQTWTSILLAVYAGALLLFSPILGYLADRTESRRFPLLLGLLLLTGATAMLCVGTSIRTFLIGRTLQGMSAAMVWTAGLALLADNVEKEDLGHCLGYITAAMSVGTLLGPLSGGIVYDKCGYFAVYEMAFALIGLDIVLRFVIIEKNTAKKYLASIEGPSYDPLLPQLASDDDEESRSSYSTNNMIKSGSGPLAISSSQRSVWQRRLPPFLWLLSSRRLLVALLASMVWGVVATSFDAYWQKPGTISLATNHVLVLISETLPKVLPLFVMRTFGWSSSGSGLIFVAMFVPSAFGPLVGYLTDKHGPRIPAAGGLFALVPFFVLLRFVTHASLEQEVLLCALLALIGLSITFVVTPVFTEIVRTVDEKEKERPGIFGNKGATAQAYGLFNSAFATGSIIGPLFAGLIKDRAGWGTMSWSLGVLCAATSVPVLLFMGGWIGDRKGQAEDE